MNVKLFSVNLNQQESEDAEAACSTITTRELNAVLGNEDLKILDCSTQIGVRPGETTGINFLKCHIKGA